MKRVLILLLLVIALLVGTTAIRWFMMPPEVRAQTNTFCAANLTCTVTAAWTYSILNGSQRVNSSQTFASALAAVSSPGRIEIDPGTYTVNANASIPANVVLVSQSGGLLSIANAVTLTLNSRPIAPPGQQIFSYTGTGVVSLVGAAATQVEAAWFPGADRGIQTQNAYNACPLPGCWVHEEAGVFNGMTPIQVTTAGKKLRIQGEGVKATQLNFTVSPLTIAASGLTESGSTVTVTTTTSCNTSAFAAGSFVAITGAGGGFTSAYNGVWQIVSGCTSSSFTYTNTVSGLGTVSGGTVGQAAITYAHTPASDVYQSWGEGLYDVDITGPGGNLCTSNTNTGTGLAIAGGNNGTLGFRMQNSRLVGFTLNLQQGQTGSMFEAFFDHNTFISCQNFGTTNIYIQNAQENVWLTNNVITAFGTETSNPNDILMRGGADVHFSGNSIDGSQVVFGLGGSDGGELDFDRNHVEECPGTTSADTNIPIVVNTTGTASFGPNNLYLYDCTLAGTGPPAAFIQITFASGAVVSPPLFAHVSSPLTLPAFLKVLGVSTRVEWTEPGFAITSNGFTVSNTGPGISIMAQTAINNFWAASQTLGGGNGWIITEGAAIGGTGGADNYYGDSTAHAIPLNYNNGGISNFVPKTIALTADWTCGTGGTVASCTSATIIGSGGGVPLTFPLPLVANSFTLDCRGVVTQATAVTLNQWNLLTATNGATNVTATYDMATAATAAAFGAVTDQASTTTTFQIAPSWTLGAITTKMPFHIWAKIEGASASGTVVSLQLLAPTVGDLVTIYRGTSCTIF